MCACVHAHMFTSIYVKKEVRRKLVQGEKLDVSFYHVGPRAQTQILSNGYKWFNYLTGPYFPYFMH